MTTFDGAIVHRSQCAALSGCALRDQRAVTQAITAILCALEFAMMYAVAFRVSPFAVSHASIARTRIAILDPGQEASFDCQARAR